MGLKPSELSRATSSLFALSLFVLRVPFVVRAVMFRLSRGAPSTGTLANSRGRNNKRVKKESREATTYQRFDFLNDASAEEYEEKITKYRDDFDIIYAATPNFDDKDQAILPFLSKELRFELLSIKLGLIYAGSYGTYNALRRHDIRLSLLDMGSVVRHSMNIHLVPKGCGEIIEAVLKYFIGDELGHCIRGEVRCLRPIPVCNGSIVS